MTSKAFCSKIKSYRFLCIIILAFIIFEQTYIVSCQFKCGHKSVDPKKLKKIFPKEKKSNGKNRQLSPRSMEIEYDLSELKSYKGNSKTADLIEMIEKNLKKVIGYLKELLSMTDEIVNYYGITDSFEGSCGVSHFNSKYSENSIFDLLIFPVFNEQLEDTTLASARPCLFRDDDSRPVVGIINFRPEYNTSTPNFKEYFQTIILHELTHVLGFSGGFFELKGYIIQKEVNGVVRSLLAGPKLLSAARHHFNCDNIDGIELENSGGTGTAGSHWESRIMYGDYMTYFDFQQNIHQDH